MKKIKNLFGIFLLLICAISIAILTLDTMQSESNGLKHYNNALTLYKKQDYSNAIIEFSRVPLLAGLKSAALFREARCATMMKNNDLAIRRYKKIISAHKKSSIAVLSMYNLGVLMFEDGNLNAEKYFKAIVKKYPTSQYAAPSQYYLAQIYLKKAENASDSKKEQLTSQAIQKFYTYLTFEPAGKFAKYSLDTVIKLGAITTGYDNLIIAKVLYAQGDYTNSKIYMDKTYKDENWKDWALLAHKLGEKDNTKAYIEEGLNKFSEKVETEDLYKIIDIYISLFPTKSEAVNRLNGLFANKYIKAKDYIHYQTCSLKSGSAKTACYINLYETYPDGQFAADALANVFLARFLEKKYSDVDRFGKIHMKKFPNTKSAPMVSFFMGKMSEKTKHREAAVAYYKHTLEKFPDSYYAYRAFLSLNRDIEIFDEDKITETAVVFPYKKSLEKNLVVKLALLGDYDLVEEICKSDDFVQSWIAYKRGQFTRSSILAREAMAKLETKPEYDDLRWRLVYPIHHWNVIEKYKYSNNPLILLSIMKEESHFNPAAESHVGARGLMQMMPATEKELISSYQIQKESDNIVNDIKFGSIYLASLTHNLDSKVLFALAAYNGGIGSVKNWQKTIKFSNIDEFVEQIPYPETNNYVKKIVRSYWMYSNIYN